jgi:nucleoside-diphosphate-sugar epimerase
MRIFVTGATGFIGGAIACKLAGPHEVYAMSRSAGGDAIVKEHGAEPVRGDLASLEPGALPEVDAVVHCAAWVEPWGTREQTWAINVGGTDRVLAAARAASARRFVHMSTEAVLWRGQHLRDVDETHPYPESTPFLYAETKAEAERRVLAANGDGGMTTIALRPRFVWGPGDRTILPEAKAMVAKGAFVWVDGGRARTSTTHVANLAHATELALEKGSGGETYFVTDGVETDFRSFLTQLLATEGVEVPERSLPGWLVRPTAVALEAVWRALGVTSAPPLTRHAVELLCCDCTLRIEKARRGLGYEPVITPEAGLRGLRKSRVS